MPKEAILTKLAPAPVGPYSQAVKVGPLLFISGQIALDPETNNKVQGGVTKETERIIENLKHVIEAAGGNLGQVVKTTVFMTDLEEFKFMNQVYERYFKDAPPARSTVQVSKLPRDAKVEIEAIAVLA
jgi:2-iminobutanoate/2-iminopropanoate deaminase